MKKIILAFMLLATIKSKGQSFPSGWDEKKKDSSYNTYFETNKTDKKMTQHDIDKLKKEMDQCINNAFDQAIAEISMYIPAKAVTDRQKGYKEALTDCVQLLLTLKK